MKALAVSVGLFTLAISSQAAPFTFNTGGVTDAIGMASRPSTAGKIEIETGDDFLLTDPTRITSATFTGLLANGATTADVGQVVVEIYRVFPADSDVGRTTGSPDFSTDRVPTRVNSPSDVALESRDSAGSELTFSTTVLNPSFTAANSVLNGINPKPNQKTLGEGPVTGQEVQFAVTFTTPFSLAPGHYFFIPQVAVSTADGEFYWLSGTRPIVAPGTPFKPDLQAWIRNENLAPDWLRVGTDIVGAGTFNGAFSLDGVVVPEPSTWVLVLAGGAAVGMLRRRVRRG